MPLSKEGEKELNLFIYHTAKMKIIIAKNPHIEDKELARQLGLSYNQIQDFKRFCKMNKMKVNEPYSNPLKKDLRKAIEK